MSVEGLLFGLLLAAATLPAVCALRRPWLGVLGAAVVLIAGTQVASTWTSRRATAGLAALDQRPLEVREDGYVSSRACRACHPGHYASWHASFHRTMTQFASPAAVVAPFAGEELRDETGLHRFVREGETFWVEMPDPAWRGETSERGRTRRPVVLVTGSHHYQVYWFPGGQGRAVWAVPFIWLIDEQRWITRGAAFLGPEEKTKHILGVWNNSCIKCHSTHGTPKLDARGVLDTHVAEIGIACEACHGPAEQHVKLHRDPRERYALYASDEADPTIVNPRRLARDAAAQVCGQCHGVWRHDGSAGWNDWLRNGPRYRPGEALEDSVLLVRHDAAAEPPRTHEVPDRVPSHRLERQFWSDGMVRVSGREYNGLLETPCFERGELTCLSCHGMHRGRDDPRPVEAWRVDQLDPAMDGDPACLGCHPSYARRPSEHTHHAAGSSGSLCYNCHMPYTTYGLLKAIRSHTIDSPTVESSLRTGRPNACNACHLDRPLGWTARYLEEWYGQPAPDLTDDHREVAAAVRWTLSGDAGQRALVAWSMGWPAAREASGSDWMAPYLAQLLDDPYQAVRLIAWRSLRTLPGFEQTGYDFLAPAPERAAASRAALELWRGRTLPRAGEPLDAVLVRPDGSLDAQRFLGLLSRRDDRPVELHE